MLFPAAAIVAVLSVLPGSHWSRGSLLAMFIVVGGACVLLGVRLVLGERIPRWSLYVELVVAIVLVSVLAHLGPKDHVSFASLYIWIVLFAALYFTPPIALLYTALAGAAYIVVLSVGSTVARPVIAWLSTMGTATVMYAVVAGLMTTLRRTSREDALTGLANRRTWDERLEEELERARRNQTLLSLAVIDIDNFKKVNDRDGHHAGDRLLCELASGWQRATREGSDFLARIGGDEFGLLTPESTEVELVSVTQRLREMSPDGVSYSIGVATWDGSESAANLFRRADELMYHMKRERHNLSF